MENPTDQEDQPHASAEESESEEESPAEEAPASEEEPQLAQSLQDWVKQAKRAHELLAAVDLTKIAAHDPIEVATLEILSSTLGDLEAGKDVEHIEGIDNVQAEIDDTQQKKSELMAVIAADGWVDRISRLLHQESGSEVGSLQPLEIIPHHEGLPEFDVCIAPENGSGTGNFGIFVSSCGVFAASIQDPANKHHWRIAHSQPYDSHDEMKNAINQFSQSGFE